MAVRPKAMAHVVYRTRQFDEMIAWYQSVFGATIEYQNPAMAFLTFDEEHHRFAFADLDAIRPGDAAADRRGQVGVDHIAYEIASLDELLELYATLKAQDIMPYWAVHHGMSASLYYADPDGNQMEFTVDALPSKQQGRAFFHGEEIGNNPVGFEYDPEDWLERRRAGATPAELLRFDPAAPVSPIRGFMTA